MQLPHTNSSRRKRTSAAAPKFKRAFCSGSAHFARKDRRGYILSGAEANEPRRGLPRQVSGGSENDGGERRICGRRRCRGKFARAILPGRRISFLHEGAPKTSLRCVSEWKEL